MSSLFGGSKQTSSSTSSNKAYDTIKDAYSPLMGYATSGADALQRLLSGDASGFNAYKSATGYDATAEAGSRGITNNAAARGLLRSGGTGKALQAFGTNLQDQYAGNYMQQLLGMAGLGINAGNLITQAGQTSSSTSKSSSKPGLGGLIGGTASGIAASDRRLKKNIIKLRTNADGLSVYQYDYIDGRGPFIGVMADEVAKIKPEALGPVVSGYMTVDYRKLEGVI